MNKNLISAIAIQIIHSHINPYGKFSLDMNERIPFKNALSA
ncbi:MAG: hypothetical protein V4591_08050 [Bdellovibrionota bacterium]